MMHGWPRLCAACALLAACGPPPAPPQVQPLSVPLASAATKLPAKAPTSDGPRREDSRQLRPATQADCILVVEANVEVQMRHMGFRNQAEIKSQKSTILAKMRDEIGRCVGRLVCDAQLACVVRSRTPDEVDLCWDELPPLCQGR